MDVRCSKCGTEYEFDDAKVKPTGVAVQCTTCGHVFKVQRHSGAVPEPVVVADAKKNEDWMVRTANGDVLRFKELTTLQKWIVEQRVRKTDQISKTGKNWKSLGEISELASFFQVVEAANRASQPPVDANGLAPPSGAYERPATSSPELPELPEREQSDEEIVSAAALLPSGGYARPAMASSTSSTSSTDARAERDEQVRRNPTVPPESPTPPPVSPPPTETATRETTTAETAPSPTPLEPVLSGDFGLDVALDDDDDPVLQWQRRSRRRKILIAALLVLVAVPAGLYFGHRPTFDKVFGPVLALVEPPPPAVPDIHLTLKSARADEIGALLGDLPDHPVADPARGRLLAELAWHNVENARLAKLLGEPAPDIEQPLAAAYATAQRARASKDQAGAALANAAYLAAKGKVNETEHELAGVEEVEAEVLEARARLAQAAARGQPDPKLAEELAALAKEHTDDARLQYLALAARSMGASGEAAAPLIDEVKAFLKAAPGHEPATKILAILEKSQPEKPAAEGEGEKPKDPNAAEGEAEELTYAQLMSKARAAQDRGRSGTALKLFREAAKKNKRKAAPYVGQGWASLDLDRASTALKAFKTAVALEPSNPDAQLGFAESLRYTGKKEPAVAAYKRFLKLAPKHPEANMARNAIKSLSGN